MTRQVRPLHPLFGVEVIGLNLDTMAPAESAVALHELVARHGFAVLRNQVLPPKLHVEIARNMGRVEVHRPEASQLAEFPEVFRLAWNASDGHVDLGCYWHCDGCACLRPTRLSIYQIVVVPNKGGQTYFADSAVIWESLPVRLRERLRILRWRHASGVAHPFVRAHPSGKSENLIVNLGKTESVEGLRPEESCELITELAALIDESEAMLRHQWSEGDVLVADNWAVLHRASPPVEGKQRVLHRVSVMSLYNEQG